MILIFERKVVKNIYLEEATLFKEVFFFFFLKRSMYLRIEGKNSVARG